MRNKINLEEIFSENLMQNKSDENQMKRITEKINLLIEIRKNNTNSLIKKFEFEEISKDEKKENKNNISFSNNIKPKLFLEEIIKKNFFVFSFCYGSYLYFTKFSRFLLDVEHIVNYRKIFTFTFCFLPLGISLYFSKMDFDLKQLEIKIKGNDKEGVNYKE